ncbi:class IV lanthionine synthetase LanL [Saccharopolyspora taberi]|uniref:non-specific serine/threonine protein kinase n=1 Tax=Saccharopolyspora taberi TaxID=60895 RepID=A0ABN3V241_9PSEU
MKQESRAPASGAMPSCDAKIPGSDGSLVPLLRDALGVRAAASWAVREDEFWCRATPVESTMARQGWKLHLAATTPTAGAVLQRSLPVLLDARVPFKFAATLAGVHALNSSHAPRSSAGKFLTVYPGTDEQCAELAEALHLATVGLNGPVILSDRPYRRGSLVHYRYGSFVDQRVLTNDGLYRNIIRGPSGEALTDRREARYTPPDWARSPFADAEPLPRRRRRRQPILLGDRFAVKEAIRHANKGGVYRARDTFTGAEVVLKEARPHAAAGPDGTDARDLLRVEADALRTLAPLGVCPRVVSLFDHGGHVFLAVEQLTGAPLRKWVVDGIREHGSRGHLPAGLRMAARLAAKLEAVHGAGLVLRDFNPNNVVVVDGEPWLIDFELSVPVHRPAERPAIGTPGYAAPEQLRGDPAEPTADLFALGATILFVLTGAHPIIPDDRPSGRPLRDRLALWLPTVSAVELPAPVTSLITGLMDDDPAARPGPERVREVLAAPPGREPRPARCEPFSGVEWQEAVDGIVDHLLATMDPHNGEALWPVARDIHDPCNLQHGAAGPLAALALYHRLRGGDRVAEAIATAVDWMRLRAERDPFRTPGLYFGRAGIAWALHDAATAIGDHEATDHAVRLAKELPTTWLSPDITHGMAGLGLTALHFWQVTGDPEFAKRARLSADALSRSAREDADGPFWQTADDADSDFAGRRFHGFAHGTAGIGCFLLAAAELGGPAYLDAAESALRPLQRHAVVDDSGARWRSSPDRKGPVLPHWCSGSSGVGTFLVRLARATGNPTARDLAVRAAAAAVDHAWRGPVGQCHGLAGNAEFLLDMADHLEEPAYLATAHRIAHAIFARRVYRDGLTVFPDAEGGVSVEWADGLSGVLGFLLRLRYGCPRQWTTGQADRP